jgi:hypothetical protein
MCGAAEMLKTAKQKQSIDFIEEAQARSRAGTMFHNAEVLVVQAWWR